ncbi:unnamed protein product [Ceutorhynchus assimilis]|uniref:Uncharacterized protein n=1 Tax=Ceutorhynchus assimilis TaxID=467358 RepID=A0A9N9MWZ2_9CUCU|nr:unnamed protein product [Ceutorhynchus assimilis]
MKAKAVIIVLNVTLLLVLSVYASPVVPSSEPTMSNFIKKKIRTIDNMTSDDEKNSSDLNTAEAAIFRPLFVYRKYSAQRRRISRPYPYYMG